METASSQKDEPNWFTRLVSTILPAPQTQVTETAAPEETPTAEATFTPTAALVSDLTATATLLPTTTASPEPTATPASIQPQAPSGPGIVTDEYDPYALLDLSASYGPGTITYEYDPLNRLTSASYSNNDHYFYTYDAVGNRKTQETLIGRVLTNTTYSYDDANRLTSVDGVTYTWDANGNLRSDGVNTYNYDAANRLISFDGQGIQAAYAYNGLGDRLQETMSGNVTTFTMDLNTALTQALSDGTHHYIYGPSTGSGSRIAQTQGSTTEYFLNDALGSVRQMTNNNGSITYTQGYDPYGVTTLTSGSSRSAYGYGGEYSDSYIKLIYLRSRMYDPLTGRFTTKDSWQGDYNRPLSLNRWMYVEGNPVNLTDPSGHFPTYCQSMPTKGLYELCVLGYYQLEPISYFELGKTVQGERGCYSGPEDYRAPGYLEGVGLWALIHRGGYEVVYDFARMERMEFTYYGSGANDAVDAGIGGILYSGKVMGFRSDQSINRVYRGLSSSYSLGPSVDVGFGIGAGKGGFVSWSDIMLRGKYYYAGASLAADLAEGVDIDVTLWSIYSPMSNNPTVYATNGTVNRPRLITDIATGKGSPWGMRYPSLTQPSENIMLASRMYGIFLAMKYANAYEEIRNENNK